MDWLQQAAHRRPDAPALVVGGRTVSYGDLDAAATAAAATLARSGVEGGDRVAFGADGNAASVAALWGIPRAGAAAVPLARNLPPTEAMRRTRELGVKAVWSPTTDAWMRRGGGHILEGAGPPDPDARFVVFTSGTGGRPRGAILSGRAIAASVRASRSRLGNAPGDRWLCVLPLHHVGGLSILWRSAQAGGSVVLEDGFDARRVAALMRGGGVEFVSLVPTMLRRILEIDPGPYRGLRAVLVGGGVLDAALLRRALAAGIPALETYGSTETASQIATTAPEDASRAPAGAGMPVDGIEVRIVDRRGVPVPPGTPGRIEVRGSVLFSGYADGPQHAPDEWFAPGDVGILDGEGRLSVMGRSDDVIVTGGENVAAAAVEGVLGGIAGVVDVRVRGEDDPEWGRAVVADIVLAAGIRLADVEAAARRLLAPAERPKRWYPVSGIDRGWKNGLSHPEPPEQDQGTP